MAHAGSLSAAGRSRVVGTTSRPPAGSPDWMLIGTVVGLTLVGLIVVFSASVAVGQQAFGDPHYFATRQAAGAAIGLIVFLVLARMNYRRLRGLSPLLLLAAVVLLIAVLLPGVGLERNNAQRWIQVGPLPPLQPSEFAKLAVAIYLAAWLAGKGENVQHVSLGVVPFAAVVGSFGFLIMAEPDLGTALVIVVMAGAMFFVAGAALRHVLTLSLIGGGVLFGIIAVFGYGLNRFTQFTSAESDPQGGGFQILQLLIALGSGGATGVGLGESRQKYLYIPSAHTDGIFAVIGEELGLIGTGLILLGFCLIAYRGVCIARRTQEPFGQLLAVGIVSWVVIQALFNMGGITRLIPLTGVPLPFVSFGSSALIATLAASGVLVSISRFTRENEASTRGARGAGGAGQRREAGAGPPRIEAAL